MLMECDFFSVVGSKTCDVTAEKPRGSDEKRRDNGGRLAGWPCQATGRASKLNQKRTLGFLLTERMTSHSRTAPCDPSLSTCRPMRLLTYSIKAGVSSMFWPLTMIKFSRPPPPEAALAVSCCVSSSVDDILVVVVVAGLRNDAAVVLPKDGATEKAFDAANSRERSKGTRILLRRIFFYFLDRSSFFFYALASQHMSRPGAADRDLFYAHG